MTLAPTLPFLRFLRRGGSPGARAWLIVLLVLLSVVGVGLGAWRTRQSHEQQMRLQAQTAPVIRQDLQVNVTASGVIRPLTPVNISPKQPGRIAAILVDQGDRVRAGQLLARMDDSNLRGELLSAEGNLAAAEANLAKLQAGNRPEEIRQAEDNLRDAEAQMIATRSTYASNQELFAAGALGRVALDASRSQYLSLQQRINALKAQLDLMRAGSRREDIAAARAKVTQARGQLQTVRPRSPTPSSAPLSLG